MFYFECLAFVKGEHHIRLDRRVLPAEMSKIMFQGIPMRNGRRVIGIRSQLMSLEINKTSTYGRG